MYGQDKLVELIRSYAGGVSDDEAFEAALGVDVAGFEAGWLADLGAAAPTAFGPQPAPPGPLPPGWEAQPTASPAAIPSPTPGASELPGAGGGAMRYDVLALSIGTIIIIIIVAAVMWERRKRRVS